MSSNTFPVRVWQLVWYIWISIAGITGNSIVIYVSFNSKDIQRKAPFNVYLLTLAIVDLLISIFAIPIYILSTNYFKHPSGEVGEWLCKTITGYFLIFILLDMSVFLLVAVTIERRRAIIKPFSILTQQTMTKTLAVVFSIIMLGFVTQIQALIGSHYSEQNATVGNSCVYISDTILMQVLYYNSFIFTCVIPTIILIVCFRQINQCLSRTETNFISFLDGYKRKNNRETKIQNLMTKRKQTIDTVKLVVVIFLICVIINGVVFLVLHPVTKLTNLGWNSNTYQFTIMLRFSSSFINPMLYGFKSKAFRKRLQTKTRSIWCRRTFCLRQENLT